MDETESKLKRNRLKSGLTQTELSEASGINIKSICSYEQDAYRLSRASVSTVMKLADCLGCTVEDIVDRKQLT